MRTYIIIFSFSIVIGCSNSDNKSNNSSQQKNIKIINDCILAQLTESPTLADVKSNYTRHNLTLSKTPQINFFDSTQIDTLQEFCNNLDTILVYKSKTNEFIQCFSIKSKNLRIGKGIRVGMTMNEVINILNIKEKNINIISFETEGPVMAYLNLIFRNAELQVSDIG